MADNLPTVIRLNGKQYSLQKRGGRPLPLTVQKLEQFQQQPTQGEPSNADQQFIHQLIRNDWSAGAGLRKGAPDAVIARYWKSQGIWAATPEKLSLGMLSETVTIPAVSGADHDHAVSAAAQVDRAQPGQHPGRDDH